VAFALQTARISIPANANCMKILCICSDSPVGLGETVLQIRSEKVIGQSSHC
jgi:hypothetical protein